MHELREIRKKAETNKKPDAIILTQDELNNIRGHIVIKKDKYAQEQKKKQDTLKERMDLA